MTVELSQPGSTLADVEPSATEASIQYVRPRRTALTWLERAVAELKAGNPLRPVSVVVSNYVLGRFVRRHVGRAGGCVNVRTLRIVELATSIAPPTVGSRQVLDPVLESSAVRAALVEADTALSPLAQHLSVHDALLQLFRELRRQELDVTTARAGAVRDGRSRPANVPGLPRENS